MVDFTESMLGIDSPSVGVGTVPSAGLTTMLKVVFGARGLSAHALPEDETRPAARASADAPAMVLTSRAELIVASSSEWLRGSEHLNPVGGPSQGCAAIGCVSVRSRPPVRPGRP